jgi:predicted AlkP superfamily phosphohydrolase/phosphomutase
MRRPLLLLAALALAAPVLAADAPAKKKVLVLGIDGLDPNLLERFVAEGALPSFERLIAEGDFERLQTTAPPLSPIAWSTFITGMDPGGHGIFDFIHRDPDTLMPYLSMAETVPTPELRRFRVGSRCIPMVDLLPGYFREEGVKNLREGRAFWQILDDHDVPSTMFAMPVNYPPVKTKGKSFAGMGTPDIRGSPGMFSYFSDRRPANASSYTGGDFYPVKVEGQRVEAELCGPTDPYHCGKDAERVARRNCDQDQLVVPFSVDLDPEQPVARFTVQEHEFILREGEWSPWVRVDFEVLPLLGSVSAIGRFYLKEVRPEFKLYVTPLHVTPEDPALPLSEPASWSHELFESLGPFHTRGLPEDTKAFSNDVLTGREFWEQASGIRAEQQRMLDLLLGQFEQGLLFFYFSTVDQNAHMLWQYMDRSHPNFQEDEFLMNGIRKVYADVDASLGRVLAAIDEETTLVVMSDHGFCPFYWGVNLNTWLLEQGYVALKDPAAQERQQFFAGVDWSRTRAYAVGLNGLYVNQLGRERRGIVPAGAEYELLLDGLERDLLALRDPRNGQQVVTQVTRTHRDFHGPHVDRGPDIVVGYNWGYRSSWKSPLGEFPKGVFEDNRDAWSGDHSVDPRLVPGVLISNKRITLDSPALYDLTVAILDEYGVAKTPEMIGKDCLGERVGARPAE